ncbi:hypothetical protein [Sphingobium sp.]|uniref:hypothetical protein n=1 Tax=Sphingobium sp. TaxID=1912891 RepID=UPI002600427B|nr:hypothetical protein [Sphingobium sp.]
MSKLSTFLATIALSFTNMLVGSLAYASPTLDDLWVGNAHFEQVGQLNWPNTLDHHSESAGWFAVRNGIWYVFNRAYLTRKVDYCPLDYAKIVVHQSTDQGKSWSEPVVAVEPGDSPGGDDCNALDGSTYFDQTTGTWHILSQCLTKNEASLWSLCHYSRRGDSPMGRFRPDKGNPVVRGGALWSRICAGKNKSCPVTTQDEGTPEILGKHRGSYIVTFHGWSPKSGHGYRGVAATKDFRSWRTNGSELPGDAMFSAKDCQAWLEACIGIGATSTFIGKKYAYVIGEVMDKNLACQKDQKWVFELFRVLRGAWPQSGAGKWQKLPGDALLTPTWRDGNTLCQVSYARWIVDGDNIYLVYEDWGPERRFGSRRLLQLKAGKGSRIQKTD